MRKRQLVTIVTGLAFLLFGVADATATVYFIHPDHLGTPQVVTDSSGVVKWRADIDPFGKATITTSTLPSNLSMNLRFPGQYYDSETGLHDNHFRTYDPAAGRYLQSDPIGLAGGINTYAYVKNNPLTNIDPTGESAVGWVAVVLGCIDAGLWYAKYIEDASTEVVGSQMNADRVNQCGKSDPLTTGACYFVQKNQSTPIRNAMENVKTGSEAPGTVSGEFKPDPLKLLRDLLKAGRKL